MPRVVLTLPLAREDGSDQEIGCDRRTEARHIRARHTRLHDKEQHIKYKQPRCDIQQPGDMTPDNHIPMLTIKLH
ncbi:hypothetical protein LSAT2_004836 [Lamellibrachia satsuma]|nr:hypothetical protein LSAT2_004836 [Lamellibrachia satsuma]